MSSELQTKYEAEVRPFIGFGRFSAVISGSDLTLTDEENKVRNDNLLADLKDVTLPGNIPLVTVPLGSYTYRTEIIPI